LASAERPNSWKVSERSFAMASGSRLRCTSECLQFTCDTIDTDSKAVTKECVDELMRGGGGVVVGGRGGAERRRRWRDER
jgi:hypothetical protein